MKKLLGITFVFMLLSCSVQAAASQEKTEEFDFNFVEVTRTERGRVYTGMVSREDFERYQKAGAKKRSIERSWIGKELQYVANVAPSTKKRTKKTSVPAFVGIPVETPLEVQPVSEPVVLPRTRNSFDTGEVFADANDSDIFGKSPERRTPPASPKRTDVVILSTPESSPERVTGSPAWHEDTNSVSSSSYQDQDFSAGNSVTHEALPSLELQDTDFNSRDNVAGQGTLVQGSSSDDEEPVGGHDDVDGDEDENQEEVALEIRQLLARAFILSRNLEANVFVENKDIYQLADGLENAARRELQTLGHMAEDQAEPLVVEEVTNLLEAVQKSIESRLDPAQTANMLKKMLSIAVALRAAAVQLQKAQEEPEQATGWAKTASRFVPASKLGKATAGLSVLVVLAAGSLITVYGGCQMGLWDLCQGFSITDLSSYFS
ncbi:hypothetical protein K2W90_05750 [Candidatus Babeliales bacterium]|nr:hypothetical protein [Candidatus Babeliales bacterium]